MPETEEPVNIDLRILEELTFIADHLISVENLLREMLLRMDDQKMSHDATRIP